jgi:Sigma-70 region 2
MTANDAADSERTAPAARTAVVSSGEPAGEVLADLYRTHALGLVRLALLLVGDQGTAEDVVQDVFARLHSGGAKLRDPDKAVPYLRTSVLNGCRSVLRSRRRAHLLRVPYEPPVWSANAAAERQPVRSPSVYRLSEDRRQAPLSDFGAPGEQRNGTAVELGAGRVPVAHQRRRQLPAHQRRSRDHDRHSRHHPAAPLVKRRRRRGSMRAM